MPTKNSTITEVSVPQNQVQYGQKHQTLDSIERFLHKPRNLVARVLGNEESAQMMEARQQEAVKLSTEYLQRNSLGDVYLDVRRYAPREQWQRIRANQRVSPALKYTAGALSWAGYTLLPGRVLRTDQYDIFSNSLSLNSFDSVSALYAAAEAKKYRERKLPGIYWGMQALPGVPVVHHLMVGADATAYARELGDENLSDDVRKHAITETAVELATEFINF